VVFKTAQQRGDRLVVAWLAALVAIPLAPVAPVKPAVAIAAEATTVDVSPEHGSGPLGGQVTLTARV
jgi:hypothetical protein